MSDHYEDTCLGHKTLNNSCFANIWCTEGYYCGKCRREFEVQFAAALSERDALKAKLAEAVDAMKHVDKLWFEPEPNLACTNCDMGGAGNSSKGEGHHDDSEEHYCQVLKVHEALAKIEATGEAPVSQEEK